MSRTYLTARFEVSSLTQEEREQLALEVAVQAERSEGHREVPSPSITITEEAGMNEQHRDIVALGRLTRGADHRDLIGATIIEAVVERVDEDDDQGYLYLVVQYRPTLRVNGKQLGTYCVWRDEEGNGPGHIALVGNPDPEEVRR